MSKISDRSLYRKIQVVIEEAGKGKVSSFDGLVASLSGHLCFTYYKGPGEPAECDNKTIENSVELAIKLGFIDEHTMQITKTGIRALNRDQFSAVLKQRIKSYLNSQGLPFETLLEVIQKILADARSSAIPSWESIFDRIIKLYGEKVTIDRRSFHVLLTLLGNANGIAFSRKKIYLPYMPE